ncbi:OstA family protein [Sphingomonas sp. SM33]|jgi:lipopolysaccharide export system protein LptA|uniref:OstA family protein n=1 Tax=Sphingomonas telluris TaxID=2907998 RepID=A0ABS9VP79_9SPHN|nr:LptA/OstA family protein [Sphingomonas telluris]MCH8616783.1 OstA family protein [Sphingomonas telluris]
MTTMRRLSFLFVPLALASATAGAQSQPSQQQQPISALKGHNSNAPIDVAADRIEVQDRADRAIFAGNVHVKQDELTLDTARLTVAYTSGGGVQIQRLDASGGVTVHSPSETARGSFGIYDLDRKLITLVGDVVLQREGSQINGQRLVIDLDSGRAVIEGGPAGVGQSGGRVTGHFTVPQKKGG